MKTITVGELRQNPTEALNEVEAGETYVVTRHNREVARLVPPPPGLELIPPKHPGGTRLTELEPLEVRTAASIDELLAEDRGDR